MKWLISAVNDHVNFVKIDIDECQDIQMVEKITVIIGMSYYE